VRNVTFIGSGFKREQHVKIFLKTNSFVNLSVLYCKLWCSEPNKKLENVVMRSPNTSVPYYRFP